MCLYNCQNFNLENIACLFQSSVIPVALYHCTPCLCCCKQYTSFPLQYVEGGKQNGRTADKKHTGYMVSQMKTGQPHRSFWIFPPCISTLKPFSPTGWKWMLALTKTMLHRKKRSKELSVQRIWGVALHEKAAGLDDSWQFLRSTLIITMFCP